MPGPMPEGCAPDKLEGLPYDEVFGTCARWLGARGNHFLPEEDIAFFNAFLYRWQDLVTEHNNLIVLSSEYGGLEQQRRKAAEEELAHARRGLAIAQQEAERFLLPANKAFAGLKRAAERAEWQWERAPDGAQLEDVRREAEEGVRKLRKRWEDAK